LRDGVREFHMEIWEREKHIDRERFGGREGDKEIDGGCKREGE
jgi:hypothetical protein